MDIHCKQMYYFSDDILAHILSYCIELREFNLVSKQWYKMNNDKIVLSMRSEYLEYIDGILHMEWFNGTRDYINDILFMLKHRDIDTPRRHIFNLNIICNSNDTETSNGNIETLEIILNHYSLKQINFKFPVSDGSEMITHLYPINMKTLTIAKAIMDVGSLNTYFHNDQISDIKKILINCGFKLTPYQEIMGNATIYGMFIVDYTQLAISTINYICADSFKYDQESKNYILKLKYDMDYCIGLIQEVMDNNKININYSINNTHIMFNSNSLVSTQ